MSERSQQSPTVLYIARDIERALSMEPSPTYHILTNKTPYAESIQKKYPDFVHVVEENATNKSSRELLKYIEEHQDTFSMLNLQSSHTSLLVFKNTSQIEEICAKNKWKLLNPPSALAEKNRK